MVARFAVVLVVVVRGLQDGVVLCLCVAVVVSDNVLGEGVGHVVILVRHLIPTDGASGRSLATSCSIPDQSSAQAKLGAEAALRDSPSLAASLPDLPLQKVALLRLDIRRSGRLYEFDEAAVAVV